MALIYCPECRSTVSDKATNCPNCGYPIAARMQGKKQGSNTKVILIIALAILAVAGLAVGIYALIKSFKAPPQIPNPIESSFAEKITEPTEIVATVPNLPEALDGNWSGSWSYVTICGASVSIYEFDYLSENWFCDSGTILSATESAMCIHFQDGIRQDFTYELADDRLVLNDCVYVRYTAVGDGEDFPNIIPNGIPLRGCAFYGMTKSDAINYSDAQYQQEGPQRTVAFSGAEIVPGIKASNALYVFGQVSDASGTREGLTEVNLFIDCFSYPNINPILDAFNDQYGIYEYSESSSIETYTWTVGKLKIKFTDWNDEDGYTLIYTLVS